MEFKNVDFLLPAERVSVIDHRGVKAFTGGTSYAVPRMTALIARYLIKNKFILKDIYKFPFTTWEDRFYFNSKFK